MNTCYVVRPSRPAGLFSFGLLDGLPVRLRRPYLREAPAGFGLERFATAFTNNPGEYVQAPLLQHKAQLQSGSLPIRLPLQSIRTKLTTARPVRRRSRR